MALPRPEPPTEKALESADGASRRRRIEVDFELPVKDDHIAFVAGFLYVRIP